MEEILDKPIAEKKSGKLIYKVATRLNATEEEVWDKISDPRELKKWDTMLIEIDGKVEEGGWIKLRSKISPDRSFKLKVSAYEPFKYMVWESGFNPVFKGVREYHLESTGGVTTLKIEETFSGWMLPFMKKMLPDCETLFGTYVTDLKKEMNSKNP